MRSSRLYGVESNVTGSGGITYSVPEFLGACRIGSASLVGVSEERNSPETAACLQKPERKSIVSKKSETNKGATRTNTVRLHRVLATKPEKIYRAFLDADAMAKWLPPNGFTCSVEHMEAKVGGKFRMSFKNFTTGNSHSFGGEFLELVPHELIRYTDVFDDPNLPGTMLVTVNLQPVSVGTDIKIEQSGVPSAIPIEACYIGWQQSLSQLAQLVEPEISD